jgi:hypothetical protein
MILQVYNPLLHENGLRKLLDQRQLSPLLAFYVPETGLVSCKFDQDIQDYEVIACGFIRRIEGNYGLLDAYIADKFMDKEKRDQTLDEITSHLIQLAKKQKVNHLFAFSALPAIIKRAQKHGFEIQPNMQVLTMSLNGKGNVCHF